MSCLGDARPFSCTCANPVFTVSVNRKPPSVLLPRWLKLANSSKAVSQNDSSLLQKAFRLNAQAAAMRAERM